MLFSIRIVLFNIIIIVFKFDFVIDIPGSKCSLLLVNFGINLQFISCT